jgi:phosphoenolpyruvate carboxylase
MNSKLPETLRDNVRMLGELLGETIIEHQGLALFRKIEDIRALSKSLALSAQSHEARQAPDYQPLVQALGRLPDAEVLPIARAFNQFLNLANIADLQHFQGYENIPGDRLGPLLEELVGKYGKDELYGLMQQLRIELVLTAHPTEVTRRTLIHKYEVVANTLAALERQDLPAWRERQLRERLVRVVEEIWHTDEIRDQRPTAVDEAKWGFAVIENSLWQALPDYLGHLDGLCLDYLGRRLPTTFGAFACYSWMGGDRDGNPNVTHEVTRQVILLGRWKAADLYLQDIAELGEELSMHDASEELRERLTQPGRTPYRELLDHLRRRLEHTQQWAEDSHRHQLLPEPAGLISGRQDLLDPLLLCHASLKAEGLHHVANGPLLDCIRRVQAFGINLLPLDIRQHSERHALVLDELCRYLELGSYLAWDEEARQSFLLEQLQGKRPLLPRDCPFSEESAEVLATCRVIAAQPMEALSHYVISMATHASDVLAVALLLRECGVGWHMPIVPLFETLDDLQRAPAVMAGLWELPWYRAYTQGRQTVMIGYSDSAKDAGKFAATWAQYRCQEALVEIAGRLDMGLHLFHGRGGTIGRGGGPVEKAMASQPPGSVRGSIRVTEQGEMIRYKFGLPDIAFNSLDNYLQATLRATVDPAPPPKNEWRQLMETMAEAGLQAYRRVVRENADFVPYFRSLTPEQELNKLSLGSRPAKRKDDGGVESLRAIPWVFAWTQVCLNLPGWLGTRQALEAGLQQDADTLHDMLEHWHFFSSFIDLLEMVLGKCDSVICSNYEAQLVQAEYQSLGHQLRQDMEDLCRLVNSLKGQQQLLDDTPLLQHSINVRKPYVDPLNYLQAELLKRERRAGRIAPELERALLVTMSGIAAGMRNTG